MRRALCCSWSQLDMRRALCCSWSQLDMRRALCFSVYTLATHSPARDKFYKEAIIIEHMTRLAVQ